MDLSPTICKVIWAAPESLLLNLQPPRNTQPRPVGAQYLVFQFAAFEKHTFAVARRNRLYLVGVVDAQFPAIRFLPAGIQIHNHRIGPALVVPELIEVFFIKSAFFIQGIMKLISADAGIAGAVQIADKTVHQFEKGIFMRIVVPAVEPVYFIASDQMVVHGHGIVPDARREQLFARIEGD